MTYIEPCETCQGAGQVGMQLDGQPLVCEDCGGSGRIAEVPEEREAWERTIVFAHNEEA